jgi:ubiquinone/menaquinone biosynthesis C-methylase UbiE
MGTAEVLPRERPADAPAAGASGGEQRRSARRSLLCEVSRVEGLDAKVAAASAIGPDGALLLCTGALPVPGTRFRFTFALPLQPPAKLDVGAVVVRRAPGGGGFGVRFTDISSRNRAVLTQYAHHMLADDSMKRLQREFGDVIRGHLIATALRDEARDALDQSARECVEAKVIFAGRRFKLCDARLEPIESERLPLRAPGLDAPPVFSPVYIAFLRREVQYVFETVVLAPNGTPLAVQIPDRIYSTERRARSRQQPRNARLEIDLPYAPRGALAAARVLDYDAGGFALSLPATALVLPGTRLPRCRLFDGERLVAEDEAIVRNVLPAGPGEIRVGAEFGRRAPSSGRFDARTKRDLRRPLGDTLRAVAATVRSRIAKMWSRHGPADGSGVEVVRFRNADGEEIVGLLDRTEGATRPVDIGVVIQSPGGKRKETFTLLARTLVENFQAMGKSAVVLRYDNIRSLGESANDPGCTEEGKQVLHSTLGQFGRDMDTALRWVSKVARPKKLALVSISISAIAARGFLAKGRFPHLDAWVALYGCPDAADITRQLTSGEDVFAAYRAGEQPIRVLLGHPMEIFRYVQDAIDERLETLEDAVDDMARITTPVTWVVGEHDCWVRAERIRRLLNAPGGGVREIFEVPTGHLVRTGEEALETFKLVAESIAKHALGERLTARDPDLFAGELRSKREWARVLRPGPDDPVAYWSRHLFGEGTESAGYDILKTSTFYNELIEQEYELAEIGPRMRVADLGCGTGNFAELAARRALERGAALDLTFLDIVPEAVRRTAEKVEAARAAAPPEARGPLAARGVVASLEVSRLKPVHDFLSGALYGVEALAGRIEGLPDDLPPRLRACYSPDLHAILRGRPATADVVRSLIPGIEDAHVEVILDFAKVARFLRGESIPGDAPRRAPETTAELSLARLRFPGATRRLTTDLPDSGFDRVVLSLVMSYIYQTDDAIAEVYRSLRPGGIVVLSSLKPNFDASEGHAQMVARIQAMRDDELPPGETREAMLGRLRGFINYVAALVELEEQGTFRFFDGDALRALLERAGFVDVRTFPGAQAVVARGTKPIA